MNCEKCIKQDVCIYEEDADGLFYGECPHFATKPLTTQARWKGAGMGDYYCSLCCETYSGSSEWKFCPNCGASMF